MTDIIHIVSRFDGIGGTEFHAASLAAALRPLAQVKLWADEATAAAPRYGAQAINTFGGAFPRGGILIMVGTHLHPGLWLDHARPERLVVICNLFSAQRIFAFLSTLERPTLPVADLAFMSQMLQQAIGLPGRISPTLIDLERFHPSRRQPTERFTIGRHSRDDPLKHHPDDASLYAMLGWAGAETRLIGASHLQGALSGTPRLQVFPVGWQAPDDFLAGLDCFYYRTHPAWTEAGGRVVMEALASGLPVVAHPGGGYAEWIVEGENGFLAATQEGLYERLLELKTTPATATHLSQNARKSAVLLCGGERRATYLNWLLGA
jgi:glycosyltransferase involved in cell wall biosynthesis